MKQLFNLNSILIYVVIIIGLISLSGCAGMDIVPLTTTVARNQKDHEVPTTFIARGRLIDIKDMRKYCTIGEFGCKGTLPDGTFFLIYTDEHSCRHEAAHVCSGDAHKGAKRL